MKLSAPLLLIILLLSACADLNPRPPTPTARPPEATPTLRPSPTLARPTATPPPTPTPVLEIQTGAAIIVGGEVRTRKEPNTTSDVVDVLQDHQRVDIKERVKGENWLVGTQTWVTSFPSWATEWFQIADGSYVYGAFVFILQPGEVSPVEITAAGATKWIDVDISEQTARAMVGDKVVFTAPMSSGAAPFSTSLGSFAVQPDGRIAVERMTASQAGYTPEQTQYDVERVLFTQYFDQGGDALHLNYWRPHSVFGKMATSHGCVGLELHEAQYLWVFAKAGTKVEIHQ